MSEDSNPDKVKCYGPGLEKGLKAEEQTHFTVDCTEAGLGDISIGMKCTPDHPKKYAECDVPFDIIKNDNDTFTVKYTPQEAGMLRFTYNCLLFLQYCLLWQESTQLK